MWATLDSGCDSKNKRFCLLGNYGCLRGLLERDVREDLSSYLHRHTYALSVVDSLSIMTCRVMMATVSMIRRLALHRSNPADKQLKFTQATLGHNLAIWVIVENTD